MGLIQADGEERLNTVGVGSKEPSNKDSCEGELERIIRVFNKYEPPNFKRYVDPDGFCWWDAMRFTLIHKLSVEQGAHGTGLPEKSAPIHVRAANLTRQLWLMQRELASFFAMPREKFTLLTISNRTLPYLQTTLASESEPNLVIGNAQHLTVDYAIAKQSVDFAVRILMSLMKPPADIIVASNTIAQEVREIFNTKLDIEDILITRYRMNMAGRRVWTWLFDRLPNLRRIVYVNDDTLKFATYLANARGIDTEEVQHGYMGASHGSFAYPPLPNPPSTIPKRCIITRDTGDIVYPAPLEFVPDPKPKFEFLPLRERPFHVVIGASPTQVNETLEIIEAIAPRRWKVGVRLHPAQTKAGFQAAMADRFADIQIIDPRQSFFEAAAMARIFVPVASYSTTGFEAAEAGCRVVLLHRAKRKASSILSRVASGEAYDLSELPEIIDSLLRRISGEIPN